MVKLNKGRIKWLITNIERNLNQDDTKNYINYNLIFTIKHPKLYKNK